MPIDRNITWAHHQIGHTGIHSTGTWLELKTCREPRGGGGADRGVPGARAAAGTGTAAEPSESRAQAAGFSIL